MEDWKMGGVSTCWLSSREYLIMERMKVGMWEMPW